MINCSSYKVLVLVLRAKGSLGYACLYLLLYNLYIAKQFYKLVQFMKPISHAVQLSFMCELSRFHHAKIIEIYIN